MSAAETNVRIAAAYLVMGRRNGCRMARGSTNRWGAQMGPNWTTQWLNILYINIYIVNVNGKDKLGLGKCLSRYI